MKRVNFLCYFKCLFYLCWSIQICQAQLQTQENTIVHETVKLDSQASFAEFRNLYIDKRPQIPTLNFELVVKKTLDNSYRTLADIYTKMSGMADFSRIIHSSFTFCESLRRSRTIKTFERFGNLTARCPLHPGTYVVTQHVFNSKDFPTIPAKKVKVVVRLWKDEKDWLGFTYTGNVFRGKINRS